MHYEALNTLYVTTQRTYLKLDHDTLKAECKEDGTSFQMPLLHLGGIVCFGNISLSSPLMHRCAKDGKTIILLDWAGHFAARLEGPVSGNVLLRRAQYEALTDEQKTLRIAKNFLAGKLQNSRQVLLRAARETDNEEDKNQLVEGARHLGRSIGMLEHSKTLDEARGYEGEAARAYFQVFSLMIRKEDREAFALSGRTRRPPLDRMNALLSYLYTLLRIDCATALESVGLDPQAGYLHALRPGRPALALDLMEELRPILADRLVLSLVNRHQIKVDDFEEKEGGAIFLTDNARKEVIKAYQLRKEDEVQNRVVDRKIPLALMPFIQSRLLARHLRGDLPEYLPFIYK